MSASGATVYIGLGSNLGDSITTLHSAIQDLKKNPNIAQLSTSKLYRSKPVGPQDQPDYWNAVAQFQTCLTPHQVLYLLLDLEKAHGRDRVNQVRWGARTLDLDVLLYDQLTISTPDLVIPHPYLTERAFVVHPLLDLSPQLVLPNGKALSEYCTTLQEQASTMQVTDLTLQ